jgi:hypothetical protein
MSGPEQFICSGQPGQPGSHNDHSFLKATCFGMFMNSVAHDLSVLLNGMPGLHDASIFNVDLYYPFLAPLSITIFGLDEAIPRGYNRRH